MDRRIIKAESGVEAYREARPVVRRSFGPGAVLNRLQETERDISRFTIEGEGAETWCCPQTSFENSTTHIARERSADASA
jgi:hypothetical protein